MKNAKKDLKFFEDKDKFNGDLVIEDGDFKICDEEDSVIQTVMNRCKTNNPDWFRHYNIGADLEDLRGKVQKNTTAQIGEEKIMEALTHDNRFTSSDIQIEGVPTSINEITYFIFIDVGKQKPLLIEYPVQL